MSSEEATSADSDELGFAELDLRFGYDTADEALRDFYVPALSRAKRYDRSVGYFRASVLSVAAKGLSRFIAGGGTARFLIGAEVGEGDRAALIGATEVPLDLAKRLAESLVPPDEIAQRRLEVLAWLVKEGRLEIRVAIAIDDDGVPVRPGADVPYFHEKIGILRDQRGDGVAFQGSVNESETAWLRNFESFSVFKSWDGTAGHFDLWADKFEQRWQGTVKGFRVYALPTAVHDELVRYAPSEVPLARDPEEPEVRADKATLSRYLLHAPRFIGSESLAESTGGVSLFPHQRKVAERLAGEYPRSWLVADEVGLGKTISAGVALRRLLLSGRATRALVLAPANVCVQWQDELFEKFGLWMPRLDGGRIHGAHPDDVSPVPVGVNPYDEHDLLLVSSHLARLPAHSQRILSARPYDLIIVDEAHHARRRAADLDEYRPSRLLQLLDRITDGDHARALWLLTATPMQIHPIELVDLLRQVGLSGPMENFDAFDRFYSELAKDDDAKTNWAFLGRILEDTPLPPFNDADRALLGGVTTKVGPVQSGRLERFGTAGFDAAELAEELGPQGRRELRAWLRHRSPIGELVTRHSRRTLKRYHALGLLAEPIADRDVQSVSVQFTREEARLYEELDGLLDRLMLAHGKKQGAGFVLTVYRRRLTSSWEAIRRTFERRLEKESMTLELDLLEEIEELEPVDGDLVDDSQAVPLTATDLAQIEEYIDRLGRTTDSKFDTLEEQLNDARGSGHAVIVFTQFTDTLAYLRDRLHPSYRSHLATYSGSGGQQWLEGEGWVGVSKQDLVDRVRSGVVSVVLATDAASEGLNLQSASYLISYDLPWNPMRVEQRIGRIDRIGQLEPVVMIRNFVIPGTVEEAVYAALASRIDLFAGLVGQLQPILGATEEAFRRIFQTPKSERARAQQLAINGLLAKVDDLERSGIELGDEDPLPEPNLLESPVTLSELQAALVDELDISLDSPGHSSTFDPKRVSRDPERWAALVTYGHPGLEPALEKCAKELSSRSPLVLRERGNLAVAYRADRTPPQRVRHVRELLDLGEPVSVGDAEQFAALDLERAAREIQGREVELASARVGRWERQIRREFRQLVTKAINAEAVVRLRRDGELPDSQLIWMDLTQSAIQGWDSADLFRQHLELEVRDLLPRGGPGADDRGDRELVKVRSETGRELVELMKGWLAVKYPDVSSAGLSNAR